jgi:hypothetical protein
VLTEFYVKFKGRNRDNLSLTHREIHGKMCSVVFQRCVWQLVGYGFLDVKRWGRLRRNCSIYGLSSRWQALSAYPKRLEDVKGMLSTITSLLREPGSAEKRERINALRRQVCEGYAAVPHKGNGK